VQLNAPLFARADETDKTLSVDYAVTHWLKNGFPADKINLGMTGNVTTENQIIAQIYLYSILL
jgi:hypothetical protein